MSTPKGRRRSARMAALDDVDRAISRLERRLAAIHDRLMARQSTRVGIPR